MNNHKYIYLNLNIALPDIVDARKSRIFKNNGSSTPRKTYRHSSWTLTKFELLKCGINTHRLR